MIPGSGSPTKDFAEIKRAAGAFSASVGSPQWNAMTPPPIRYPLPTLILSILVGLLIWKGEQWTRPLRAVARAKVERVILGPPVPASKTAQVRGEFERRGLPLRDSVPVRSAPRGDLLAPLEKRPFVSIYDEWSSKGETAPAEFYRVGTRVAIGWVAAEDLLPWETRLVVVPNGPSLKAADGGEIAVEASPIPVTAWDERTLEIRPWEKGSAWSRPGPARRVDPSSLAPGSLGVLVGRAELPSLLAETVAARDEAAAGRVRLRALLGELSGGKTRTDAEVASAYRRLPAAVSSVPRNPRAAELIAALNADAAGTETRIGDRVFRVVPIDQLP